MKKHRLKMPRLYSLVVIFAALLSCFSFSVSAQAACLNPAGTEGQIVYNGDQNVPQICTGTNWVALGILNPAAGGSGCSLPDGVEGDIVYNGDLHVPQYCDGDDWVRMITSSSGGSCQAPALCPNIGDVCGDGSLFAGFMLYNGACQALYVTDDNQSSSIQWKTSSGVDDISVDDPVDGRANHANRAGTLSDFPAFELCESNTYHGKSDWYLPSRDELHLLWKNRAAINANAAETFYTGNYWASTEYSTTEGWRQTFSNGDQNRPAKTSNYVVRCVRRD